MPMIPTLLPPPIAPQFFRGENLINIDIIQLTKKAVQIYTSVHCDSSAENWSCSLQGVASWHLRDINNFSLDDFISSKGLASYCKAETTFTFYFSILTLTNAFLGIDNREMKSESCFSFAIASQPLKAIVIFLSQAQRHQCQLMCSAFQKYNFLTIYVTILPSQANCVTWQTDRREFGEINSFFWGKH